MNFLSIGWIWLYIGAFLMLLELIVPGFVIVFFGLAAATVGVLRLALGEAFGSTGQVLVFSVASVLYILLLRRWCRRIFVGESAKSSVDFDHETVGRLGRITQAVNPPLTGRVMIGDAEWTASADDPLEAGADVRIVAQDNLTMRVARARTVRDVV